MDAEEYLSYPEVDETEDLRHNAVMVRRKIPHVPQPNSTPLPTTGLPEEERGRIFSVYLRPWVLNRKDVSAVCPHAERSECAVQYDQ